MRLRPEFRLASVGLIVTWFVGTASQAAELAPAAAAATAAAPTANAAPAPTSQSAAGGDAFKDRLTALPAAADLRPKGPVEISADRTDAVEGMTAIYSGHVNLTSDTLKLDGDRLELKQAADHAFEAKVTGGPAHMSHAGTGPDNPAMSAHAKTLNYDSRTGVVDLIGDAFVDRSGDTTTADTIRYSLADRSLQATGGKQQVHIVIQPPSDPPANGTTTPATNPPPADPAPAAAASATAAPPPPAASTTATPPTAKAASTSKKAAAKKRKKGQR